MDVAAIVKQAVCGLEYLHALGKIHRDIKAANILLTLSGHVKLADFGVSGQITATITRKTTMVGTPYWMAPEVILRSSYNTMADIWSLGITSWELVEGLPPNAQIHPMKVLFIIPKHEPPKLAERFSSEFQDFIAKCLVKRPNGRMTASELKSHPFLLAAPGAPHLRKTIADKRTEDAKVHTLRAETLRKAATSIASEPWNFDTPVAAPAPNSSLRVESSPKKKSLGRSVAFEDEFEAAFPEEKHAHSVALGTQLLVDFIIPAFQEQEDEAGSCALDSIVAGMKRMSVECPAVAEAACRSFIQEVLTSACTDIRGFLATVMHPEHKEAVDASLDVDYAKLVNHSLPQHSEHDAKITEYRETKCSALSQTLLNRWMQR